MILIVTLPPNNFYSTKYLEFFKLRLIIISMEMNISFKLSLLQFNFVLMVMGNNFNNFKTIIIVYLLKLQFIFDFHLSSCQKLFFKEMNFTFRSYLLFIYDIIENLF
jgi:hypothetical protein